MGRRLIVFADGTGNAYTVQESNVWRLYRALDRARPDQIARYIRGVGTSGLRPLALLDGATGFGVPSNVRELYRFLCWNWQPGDEIWAFGFSRGAFTIRTLIGLIASQGLVPARIGGEAVSPAEMHRNAMAAWRAYRASGASWRHRFVTITAGRRLRDVVLRAWQAARRHRPYAEVRRATAAAGRLAPEIRFLGLFDTVEAYGVPHEGLRRAIDRVVWPISFHNRWLWDRVAAARHALALDDERLTFHPLLFDRSREQATPERIQELWFAGAHADIGGGYPDDALARVALDWMGREAEAAGLRFRPGALGEAGEEATAYATCHESRRGFAAFYRYQPRRARSEGPGPLAAPLVHRSVVQKILRGAEGYAPVALPASAMVQEADGTRRPIAAALGGGPGREPGCGASAGEPTSLHATARPPGPTPADRTAMRRWIRQRQLAHSLLIACGLGLVALPFLPDALLDPLGRAGPLGTFLAGIAAVVSAALGPPADLLRLVLPSVAERWLDAVLAHPLVAIGLAVLIGGLDGWGGALRDRIAARARAAWQPAPPAPVPPMAPPDAAGPTPPSPISPRPRRPAAARLASALLFGAVLLGLLLLLHRAGVTLRTELSGLCRPAVEVQEVGGGRRSRHGGTSSPAIPAGPTASRCAPASATGSRSPSSDGFLDGARRAGVGGFAAGGWRDPRAYGGYRSNLNAHLP